MCTILLTRDELGRLVLTSNRDEQRTRARALPPAPVELTRTTALYPIDAELMRPAPVRLVLGEPVPAKDLGRVGALEECWRRVAAGLPEGNRPSPDTPITA